MNGEESEGLPSGWVDIPIEQLAAPIEHALTDGPFGSNLKTSHYTESGPRVIRLQNISAGAFVDEMAHISEEHYTHLRRHAVEPDDVLIALLGDPPARACLAPVSLGRAIVKADCVRLRVDRNSVLPAYVMYGLNSEVAKRRVAPLVHGVGRPRVNLRALRKVELPIAPRPEQARIVDAIDEHSSKLDAAVAGLERAQANLKRYRASVLQSAVEGRLVPTEAELARDEGRDYEPAEVLLDRILAERRRRWEQAELERLKAKGKPPTNDKWKSKYKEPVEPDEAELLDLPEGWCWATLDQLSWASSYGTSKKCSYDGEGEPVLRIPNVQMGKPELDDMKNSTVVLGLRDAEYLAPGDFLVIRTNGSRNLIARAALVADPLPGKHYFASYLIRYRLAEPSTGNWLLALWHSPEMRMRLEDEAATSAGQYNVSQTVLSKMYVPLPPAKEQVRIGAAVETLTDVAGVEEGNVAVHLARVERLRQAILSWAFAGRLVDQDPADEPAADLQSRLAETRSADSRTRRPRKRQGKR